MWSVHTIPFCPTGINKNLQNVAEMWGEASVAKHGLGAVYGQTGEGGRVQRWSRNK